jgi:hypothetical protein
MVMKKKQEDDEEGEPKGVENRNWWEGEVGWVLRNEGQTQELAVLSGMLDLHCRHLA